MADKIVMCPKCGKNFVDIDGVSEHLGEKPICPECKAKAGRFLRIIVAIAEKAGAAGQAIAETYKELGGELLEKANTMRHTASDIYRERQESKAQERATRLRRREEAQERKAMLRKEIIVTALHSVACQVRRNLGYVSANLYVELKDKSDKAITAIIDAKEEELLDELRLKAHQLGANAIIGLNVSKSITTIHDRAGRAVIGGLFSAYGNALEIAIRPKSPAQ